MVERFSLNVEPQENLANLPVRIESFSADWNIREIMSFGGEVELLAPAQDRLLLLERAKRALEAYLTVS